MTTVDDTPAAEPAADTEPDREEPAPRDAGHRRRRLVWLGLGGAAMAAAGAGVWLRAAGTSGDDGSAPARPDATATVERGNMSATETWDGTLARETPFTVEASTQGTVTRLASQGATVGRGDVLFRVDERPVALMSGPVPMYRDLGPGTAGADVQQLEANLAELGHRGFTVDDRYTGSTAEAVRAWQLDIGTTATGTVARSDVVFAPRGGQVQALRSEVGDVVAPGTPILDIAGTDEVVELEPDVDDLDRFDVDSRVTVVLPGGDEVTGTVRTTTVVEARPDPASEEGEEAATESLAQVEVALDDDAPDELVGAPADVVVEVDERTDVLLVPVTALLALAEGGYGLEVVDEDGTASIVPVETGLFAEGKVEVESPDIAQGTVVGVAGR